MPWMKDLRVYELTENLEGLDGLYIASDQCERSGVGDDSRTLLGTQR